MSYTYTPGGSPTFSASGTLPNDGDAANAESIGVGMRQLFDNDSALKGLIQAAVDGVADVARVGNPNTFTQPQTIDTADTTWMLMLELKPNVRLYSALNTNALTGGFALTYNARWDTDHWTAPVTSHGAFALIINYGDVTAYGTQAQTSGGPATWTDWNTVTRGDVFAQRNILAITGNITAQNGSVNAPAGNLSGLNVSAVGTVSGGTGDFGSGGVYSGGNITANSGAATVSGNITSSTGNVTASQGNISAPNGNVSAPNGTMSAKDVSASRNATVAQDLTVSGRTHLGSYTQAQSVAAAAMAAQSYAYASALPSDPTLNASAVPRSFYTAVPLGHLGRSAAFDSNGSLKTDGTVNAQYLPLPVPIGCVIIRLRVSHSQAGNLGPNPWSRFVVHRRIIDWDTPGAATADSAVLTFTADSTAGRRTTVMDIPYDYGTDTFAISRLVGASDQFAEWRLVWLPSDTSDLIHAMDIAYDSYGPLTCPS